jgi:hypothetical protein
MLFFCWVGADEVHGEVIVVGNENVSISAHCFFSSDRAECNTAQFNFYKRTSVVALNMMGYIS